MSAKTVATDKGRIVTYCEPTIKAKLEVLADLRFRSLSNLVESILAEAVAAAEAAGELEAVKGDHTA
jgi:hypothetical protein